MLRWEARACHILPLSVHQLLFDIMVDDHAKWDSGLNGQTSWYLGLSIGYPSILWFDIMCPIKYPLIIYRSIIIKSPMKLSINGQCSIAMLNIQEADETLFWTIQTLMEKHDDISWLSKLKPWLSMGYDMIYQSKKPHEVESTSISTQSCFNLHTIIAALRYYYLFWYLGRSRQPESFSPGVGHFTLGLRSLKWEAQRFTNLGEEHLQLVAPGIQWQYLEGCLSYS